MPTPTPISTEPRGSLETSPNPNPRWQPTGADAASLRGPLRPRPTQHPTFPEGQEGEVPIPFATYTDAYSHTKADCHSHTNVDCHSRTNADGTEMIPRNPSQSKSNVAANRRRRSQYGTPSTNPSYSAPNLPRRPRRPSPQSHALNHPDRNPSPSEPSPSLRPRPSNRVANPRHPNPSLLRPKPRPYPPTRASSLEMPVPTNLLPSPIPSPVLVPSF